MPLPQALTAPGCLPIHQRLPAAAGRHTVSVRLAVRYRRRRPPWTLRSLPDPYVCSRWLFAWTWATG